MKFTVYNKTICKSRDCDNFFNFLFSGNVDIVKLLISHGADISVRNNLGKTAREVALKFGFQSVARILRRAEQSSQGTTIRN